MPKHQSLREFEQEIIDVSNGDGLFAGQFSDDAVAEAVKRKLVRISYDGIAGLMGLGKIRVVS